MIISRIENETIIIINDETEEILEIIPYLCDVSDIVNKYKTITENKKLQEENKLLQERLLQLEVAEVNRKSMEIEKQIMGGI